MEMKYLLSLSLKIFFIYKAVQLYGLICTVIAMYLIVFLYKSLMYYMFGFESLTGMDKIMLGSNKKGGNTLAAAFIVDNFNAENLRMLFIEKCLYKVKKMRCKLTYKYFDYFWKEEPIKQAEKRYRILDYEISTNQEELLTFLQKEVNTPINIIEEFPYEVIFIKYKDDKKGVIIFKFDHIFSDGLGISSLLCSITDNYTPDKFPMIMKRAKFNLLQEFINLLISPLYGPLNLINFFSNSAQKIKFGTNVKFSSNSKFSVSEEFNLKDFKEIKEKYNMSFNDLFITIVSLAVKKLTDEKIPELKEVVIVHPVGNTAIPKDISEVKLQNSIYAAIFKIPLIKDFENEHKNVVKILNKEIKDIKSIDSNKKTINFISNFLSTDILNRIADYLLKSTDICVSNVPGPQEPLYLNGSKIQSIIVAANCIKYNLDITLISYNKKFKIMVIMNSVLDYSPEELINIIEDIISNLNNST
jgi:hypothetical protein